MDLSHIRVHNDAASREQARAINAKAFAYGTDIWLGPGQRADDIGLMAHEATHVIQQSAESFNQIQRDLCSSLIVGDTGEQQVSAEGGGSSRGDLSLAFGGQDQEFNLCALRRHLHETGHRKLRFQRDMVDTDSTWINCGVTQPDLYRHPAGQRYEIVGRK